MVSSLAPTPKPPKSKRGKNVMTGITLAGQMPALEHARNGHVGRVWRLWLSYNDDFSSGSYLRLDENGQILRQIIHNGRIVKTEVIKGEE